jgi:hypothetical protein
VDTPVDTAAQPPSNLDVGGAQWWAQSFDAGATGALDQVDLLLWKSATTAPLNVEIRTLSGGVPSQTVLASASVLPADVPTGIGAQNWVSVPLTPSAPSVAGAQYAIVLSTTDPNRPYRWVASTPPAATYADGFGFRSITGGASWTAFTEIDHGFKSYVTVLPTLPTSKAQCKKGGWRDFAVFKNQGDCVSFVATKGKNPPSGSPSAAKGHRSKPR